MKNLAKVLAAALVAVFLLTNAVYAETIVDRYVGATPTKNYGPWDVIGNSDYFDISKVSVTANEEFYFFDIYTAFADDVGVKDVELGDLFISTDGWKPFGNATYKLDDASNGETWEYALVIDNHLSKTGGTWNLYSVDSAITMAYHHSGSFRENQEVLYNAAGQQSLASGNWSLSDDYLRFMIDYDLLNGGVLALTNSADNYGFHWSMTCGNDVIEGSFKPVPEPATMFLLGSGLVGLGVIKRKKKIA